jgi:hypothetical protein
MKYSPSLEANSRSTSQEFPAFYWTENSFLFSQQPATSVCTEPVEPSLQETESVLLYCSQQIIINSMKPLKSLNKA